MLLAIQLSVAAVLFLLGCVFLRGKGAWLIAGYNTAPPEEKAKYDEKALCRFMGRFMLVLTSCFLVIAGSTLFDSMPLLWIGLGLVFLTVIAGIIYANTGNRFRK